MKNPKFYSKKQINHPETTDLHKIIKIIEKENESHNLQVWYAKSGYSV